MDYVPAPLIDERQRRGIGGAIDRSIIASITRQGVPGYLYPGPDHPAHKVDLASQTPILFWCLFSRAHDEVNLREANTRGVNLSSRAPCIWIRPDDFGPSTALKALPTVRDDHNETGCEIKLDQDFDKLSTDRNTAMRFWVTDIQPTESGLIKLPLMRLETTEYSQWQENDARFGS